MQNWIIECELNISWVKSFAIYLYVLFCDMYIT